MNSETIAMIYRSTLLAAVMLAVLPSIALAQPPPAVGATTITTKLILCDTRAQIDAMLTAARDGGDQAFVAKYLEFFHTIGVLGDEACFIYVIGPTNILSVEQVADVAFGGQQVHTWVINYRMPTGDFWTFWTEPVVQNQPLPVPQMMLGPGWPKFLLPVSAR